MTEKHRGRFRFALSASGLVLDQIREHTPEVLKLLKVLNDAKAVEWLDETYFHSLAFLYSREEFRSQVEMRRALIKELFGQEPRVLRNTELIYNNDFAHFVSHMGYDAVLTEGVDSVLGHRSPNDLYRAPHAPKLKLLVRNFRLSDDIAVRFYDRNWDQWPMMADKFAQWVNQINGNGLVCNLFLDLETLGQHQPAESGIFEFIRWLPIAVLENGENDFVTPGEAVDRYEANGEIDVPHMISWAETERDLSAWLGNAMQSNALHELYKLEGPVKEKRDPQLLDDWRRLTASDHFYFMCTKYRDDGPMVQRYVNPYESPYDGYINFMNVLDNVQSRIRSNR